MDGSIKGLETPAAPTRIPPRSLRNIALLACARR
jgi:hypothetical protein